MKIDRYHKTIFEWRFTPMANYACPTFKVTRNESNSPRGLALSLFLIKNNQRDFTLETAEKLYQCTSCYLCSSMSYDDTDPALLFIAARADLVEKGLVPEVINQLKDKIINYKAKSTFKGIQDKEAKVGLFIDPLTLDDNKSDIEANLELLRRAEVDYKILGTEKGSGAQLFEIGFWDQAKEIAEKNIKDLESSGIEQLIFLSPYDFRCFSQWYQTMGVKPPEGLRFISYPSFILNLVQKNRLQFKDGQNKKTTYQDSGHFSRIENGFLEIEELLTSIPRVEFNPMFKSGSKANCDGGDFLNYIYPEIQSSIIRKRLDEVVETGAEILLTSCFYAKNNFIRELKSSLDYAPTKVVDLGKFLLEHTI